MLRAVGDRFHADVCPRPDPRPELVQEARNLIAQDAAAADKTADAGPTLSPGEQLAKRAIEESKAEGEGKRSALGVQPPPVAASLTPPSAPGRTGPATVSESPDSNPAATPRSGSADRSGPAEKSGSADRTRTAFAGPAAGKTKAMADTATPPAADQKCRVWTASYGGQKSIIIRSVSDRVVNFTVLDVNSGSEAREAAAFIAAYAKNGRIAGEFTSQAQALDKAFELCPEG
jgi:hypothetical protein